MDYQESCKMSYKIDSKKEQKCLLVSLIIHLLFFVILYKEEPQNLKQENIGETVINLVEYGREAGDSSNQVKTVTHENVIEEKKQQKIEKIEDKKEIKKIEVKKEESKEVKIEESKSEKSLNKEVTLKETQNEKSNAEGVISSTEGKFQEESVITYGQFGEKIGINQNVQGLRYQILVSKDPEYPKQAKKFRIKEEITIKARFLVGIDGEIEAVDIIQGTEKFGFRESVKDCIAQWRFSPIEYKGEKIKMYFYKNFTFKVE